MKLVHSTQPDESVLLPEAARIAGRSMTWVRTYRNCGPLVPSEIDGRQAVTLDSLLALMARHAPKRAKPQIVSNNTCPERSGKRDASHLSLI
jgi:hypothetical protein